MEGNDELDWLSFGDDCWTECGQKGGWCSACMNYDSVSTSGYCCSGINHQAGGGPIENGDCPVEAVAAQLSISHSCVISKSQTNTNLAVWAGNAVNTLVVNGKRFGANWGGAEYVISMQEGERVTGLEYGIIQWDYDQDWSNSICGLYVVTNVQKHGMYHPDIPCPTEYSVSIPDGVDFADFLVDDIIVKPSNTDLGYWITGFKSQIPVFNA